MRQKHFGVRRFNAAFFAEGHFRKKRKKAAMNRRTPKPRSLAVAQLSH
jgi:hypothetical protein